MGFLTLLCLAVLFSLGVWCSNECSLRWLPYSWQERIAQRLIRRELRRKAFDRDMKQYRKQMLADEIELLEIQRKLLTEESCTMD